MGGQAIWRTGPARMLSAEVDDFRLVVHAPREGVGWARFLVLRRQAEDLPHTIIGSGSESNVRAAMAAAERMAAKRLARAPPKR